MKMSVDDNSHGPSSEEKKKGEYIHDVKTLSRPQLLELLDRQNKLIQSPLLEKLCDKGKKVKISKTLIEEELEKRNKSEDLCSELTKLSINEKKVELIEWGEKQESLVNKNDHGQESDILGDEGDPLAIIATHSGTLHNQRKIKVEKPDKPLVTLVDIEEAYALSLCDKIDKAAPKQRFLPHKTLNKTLSSSKSRDLSAATPPTPVFGDTKLISLEESLKLQYVQTQHLKMVQLKHATERLKEVNKYKMGSHLPEGKLIQIYRHKKPVFIEDESGEENNEE